MTKILKVTPFYDGGEPYGYVVSGTADRFVAKREVQWWRHRMEQIPARDAVVVPPLRRAGLFRWNPCSPRSCYDGGGHVGHIAYCDQRGPGVWEGVYFQY